MAARIRPATLDDDAALTGLDRETWSPHGSPVPFDAIPDRFFGARTTPSDVLVAVIGDDVVGYVALGRPTPVAANAHVLELHGLAVSPAHQRRGIARRLLAAAGEEAKRRGARKLRLRVFAPNAKARGLYESAGFVVEGVLREEFLVEGAYVDDVLMARNLGADGPRRAGGEPERRPTRPRESAAASPRENRPTGDRRTEFER